VTDKPKILPMAWLLIAIVLAVAMHRWVPLARLFDAPWRWFGLAPGVFGLWMMAVSARAFRKADTGLLPFAEVTALVTDGFFRYTRNPMYLGMASLLFGVALLLGTAGALLSVPLFVWVIRRNFILAEERFLEETFGKAYLAYKRRVRRWF
jgi:protein-S-isoprenylcysteine O-methyltransferase Ste14